MNAAYPVQLGTRILHNPTAGYTNFMLLGIVMNGLQIALLLTVAPLLTSVLRRKIYGAKYSTVILLAAKLPPYFLTGTIVFFIAILEIQYLWDIPMRCSFGEIYLLCATASAAFLAGGMGAAPYFKNELNFLRTLCRHLFCQATPGRFSPCLNQYNGWQRYAFPLHGLSRQPEISCFLAQLAIMPTIYAFSCL